MLLALHQPKLSLLFLTILFHLIREQYQDFFFYITNFQTWKTGMWNTPCPVLPIESIGQLRQAGRTGFSASCTQVRMRISGISGSDGLWHNRHIPVYLLCAKVMHICVRLHRAMSMYNCLVITQPYSWVKCWVGNTQIAP